VVIVSIMLDVKKMVLPPSLLVIAELEERMLVLSGRDVAKPPPVDVVCAEVLGRYPIDGVAE
jgi:hypothetical protein